MRSLKVILSLILSVCLWSEASAACAMKWKFLEENYNPTYQVCTTLLCISLLGLQTTVLLLFYYNYNFFKDDERDNALCAGKPDGFYANAGQCVSDFYGCVGGAYFALVSRPTTNGFSCTQICIWKVDFEF